MADRKHSAKEHAAMRNVVGAFGGVTGAALTLAIVVGLPLAPKLALGAVTLVGVVGTLILSVLELRARRSIPPARPVWALDIRGEGPGLAAEAARSVQRRDVFISHAGEDKEAIARPLAAQLRTLGCSVWFDDYELVLGDSLRAKISDGLQHSRVGVVILSRNFFAKRWPQWELSALTARQLAGEENVILPVLHEIGHKDVRAYSPPLADLVAAKSSDGVQAVADGVVRVLKKRIAGSAPEAALAEARVPNRSPLGRTRWRLILGAFSVVGLLLLLVSVLTPERVGVPNVVGSSISVATQRLQGDGFEVQPVRDNSDRPRNTVIGQEPSARASADKGARVTITVSDGSTITNVPDVVGLGRNAARQKLTTAGFEVDEARISSDEVRADRVAAQTPDGGSLAERGKHVKIEVSTGPERLAVPDVVGKSEDDARAALDGFRVVVKDQEDESDPGTVLAQKPKDGKLPRGTTVTLVVAIEPKPIEPKAIEPKQAAVPDVVGRSQNLATKILSGRGFEVAVEDQAVDSPAEDGLVQKQSPDSRGGKVDRGSEVTITVGHFDPGLGIP